MRRLPCARRVVAAGAALLSALGGAKAQTSLKYQEPPKALLELA